MNFFQSWLLSFVSASLLATILKLILSKSRIKKVANILYSLFIVIYIVSPFATTINDKNKVDFDIDLYENSLTEIECYEKLIESSVLLISKESEIEVIDIKIESYIDNETNDILVSLIEIEIKDKTKKQYLKEIVLEKLGFEVQVC